MHLTESAATLAKDKEQKVVDVIGTKIVGLTKGVSAFIQAIAPGPTHGWTGDVPDAASLPLWLLGLLVSLMLFRVRAIAARKAARTGAKVKGRICEKEGPTRAAHL